MTTIKENWDKMLYLGEQNQNEVLSILQKVYPDCRIYKDGKQKEADLEIPNRGVLIEIKFDYKSHETGNFAFEYYYKGQESGIKATRANYFIISDLDYHYIFRTFDLYDFIKLNQEYFRKVKGGDDNNSIMILIPKNMILNKCRNLALWRENHAIDNIPYFM